MAVFGANLTANHQNANYEIFVVDCTFRVVAQIEVYKGGGIFHFVGIFVGINQNTLFDY